MTLCETNNTKYSYTDNFDKILQSIYLLDNQVASEQTKEEKPTAEEVKNGHKVNHAQFVSFAPYDDPEIAVTVNIPYGYSSSNAATAAKNIYRYYYGYTDLDYILNNSALNVSGVEIGD